MGAIQFGTDGWRAIIAEDFTFSNLDRVAQATADYWQANPVPGVHNDRAVVGYDRRFLSPEFAARVAEVLAGNGFTVTLTDRPTPTPSVSFEVKRQKAIGGVMLTASHNPAAFNGFKLKAWYGGSAEPAICKAVEGLLDRNPVRSTPLPQAVQSRLISVRDIRGAHYAALKKLVDFPLIAASGLKFATSAGALGMFTKRVVGESDPSDAQAPKSFGAGERSGLGTGRGYVWKGSYLVELTYTNDDGTLTQDAFKAAADALLAPLGKAIGANLPADATPIPSVSALPVGSLVPGGVNFFPTDGFRIPHLGPVAEGFYRDGAKRFRMFAIARTDANDAKADMRLFKTRPKAKPESGIGDEAVSVELNGGQGAGGSSYVVARMGSTILGVGTEPFASDATLDDAARKTRLTGLAQSLTHKP